jgi:glutathione S-transferase
MKLLGTTTSPYTRKIRILLNAIVRPYQLLDTRSEAGAAALAEVAPLRKIPVLLLDSAATGASASPPVSALPDSALIARWLWATEADALLRAGWNLDPDDWHDRALLVVVEGAMDAAINYRYLRQDGFADAGYIAKQRQRVETALTWLDGRFVFRRPLGAAALSLGCALDWMAFRNVTDLMRWEGLAAFHAGWTASGVGAGTEPRE